MVWALSCDCAERVGTDVSSINAFKQLKRFFADQVEKGIFKEITPRKPYYVWSDGKREKKWYATKWYQCKECGCLWEFNYPDFPAKGFVRKYAGVGKDLTHGNGDFV